MLLTLQEQDFPVDVSLRKSTFPWAWDVKLHNQANKCKQATSMKPVLYTMYTKNYHLLKSFFKIKLVFFFFKGYC